jgi:hypothetical protein
MMEDVKCTCGIALEPDSWLIGLKAIEWRADKRSKESRSEQLRIKRNVRPEITHVMT